jgi:hypothetical protein
MLRTYRGAMRIAALRAEFQTLVRVKAEREYFEILYEKAIPFPEFAVTIQEYMKEHCSVKFWQERPRHPKSRARFVQPGQANGGARLRRCQGCAGQSTKALCARCAKTGIRSGRGRMSRNPTKLIFLGKKKS